MLIKSDKQVACDQVNQLLRLSADQYDDASNRIADSALANWFAELAGARRQFSEQLEDQIRQAGELPSRPDPDKELLTNLLVGLKEAFFSDHIAHELQQRDALEAELAEALRQAQRLHQEPGMAGLLAKLAEHVTTVRAQIEEKLTK